jgi:hypothetical protein
MICGDNYVGVSQHIRVLNIQYIECVRVKVLPLTTKDICMRFWELQCTYLGFDKVSDTNFGHDRDIHHITDTLDDFRSSLSQEIKKITC